MSANEGEVRCPNEEDYLATLQQIRDNDSTATAVNLTNLEAAKPEWATAVAEALLTNNVVETVLMANCGIATEGGKKFAELLAANPPALTALNLESNNIGPEGIKAIAEALAVNTNLKEIKLTNQASQAGNEAERVLAKALDGNKTLQRCTIQVRDTASRNTIDRVITRNRELARQARQAAKK